jgi:hypothetical protein
MPRENINDLLAFFAAVKLAAGRIWLRGNASTS